MAGQGITVQANAWADTWERVRDHARPVVPNDVPELAAVRDLGAPPSKAHVKRLQRRRVEVSKAKPTPPADVSARLRYNEAANLGRKVAQLHLVNRLAPACADGADLARSNWRMK